MKTPGLVIGLAADHGAIITAEFQRRQEQPQPILTAGPLQIRADPAVGRHAARRHYRVVAISFCRQDGTGYQLVADRRSKGGRQTGPVQGFPLLRATWERGST